MIGYIHSIESMSTVDGPGIRYVVFMQGCNLRCKFCHNVDTWAKNQGTSYTPEELAKKIINAKEYFLEQDSGVTFSGGEPLIQAKFLLEVCKILKNEHIHITIDTAGNIELTHEILELLDLVDLVLLDIKHIDNQKHKWLTGVSNDKILEFEKYLMQKNVPVWIRVVYIPSITDYKDSLKKLKQYISTLTNVKKVDVLPYHEMGKYKWKELGLKYELENVPIPTKEEYKKIENYLLDEGENMKEIKEKIEVDKLISNAHKAEKEYENFTQEQIDKIVKEMSVVAVNEHMRLAKLAVNETKRGVYEDKITKNMFASEYIYHNIKYNKTVGIIEENELEDYEIVAEPVGIIAGVTPVTNPTSTTIYKSLIAVKTRNPIIFGFHPSAKNCSIEAAKIVRDAAIKAGAPKACIQWIEEPSLLATSTLMNHPDISLILATGGAGMVKAAYSSGKPALGVGPGNVPCYIEKTCNLKRACTDLILSKTFDNGMICASEQSVIVDKEISKEFEKIMKEYNCYFLDEKEIAKLETTVVIKNKENKATLNSEIVGKSAYEIAKLAKIDVPKNTKVLIAKINGVGDEYPLSREKLSLILAYYIAPSSKIAINLAEKLIEYGGLGHSAVIHTDNNEILKEYEHRMKAGRLIVNSPSSHGAIGDIYNTNLPSLTLGCGTFGGNSTTQNISTINLINLKRVAKRRVNMQWFKVPEKIYFERGSISYLKVMRDISRVVIVTDTSMIKLGYVDKILYYLRQRRNHVHCEIFSEVEPDPSFETLKKGVEIMNSFKPDCIIALGGGSAMDAAKGMWLLYEQPDVDLDALKNKFIDIRKRVYKIENLGVKAKLVAIPTTSGTGSEVTSFAVISDKKANIKYPLADYALLPTIAIIDPNLVDSLPSIIVADTGMDVLTHAIEAYVSNMASDFTDGLCLKAIELVFKYLERSYKNPEDKEAKEKMHNASTIAGMAFSNAFLGINHSLAHKIGGEYHVPHGRANAILLPYVIKYNGTKPTKFVSFPKYESFVADEKYADIARRLGLKATTIQEGVESLVKAVNELRENVGIKATFKDEGIDEKLYLENLDLLANRAFEDQCTTANPRLPLVDELKELLLKSYYGNK